MFREVGASPFRSLTGWTSGGRHAFFQVFFYNISPARTQVFQLSPRRSFGAPLASVSALPVQPVATVVVAPPLNDAESAPVVESSGVQCSHAVVIPSCVQCSHVVAFPV